MVELLRLVLTCMKPSGGKDLVKEHLEEWRKNKGDNSGGSSSGDTSKSSDEKKIKISK